MLKCDHNTIQSINFAKTITQNENSPHSGLAYRKKA